MQKQIDDLENNVIRLQIQNTKESNSSDRYDHIYTDSFTSVNILSSIPILQ